MRSGKAASDLFGLISKVSKWKPEKNDGHGSRIPKAQAQGVPGSFPGGRPCAFDVPWRSTVHATPGPTMQCDSHLLLLVNAFYSLSPHHILAPSAPSSAHGGKASSRLEPPLWNVIRTATKGC